VRNCQMRNAKVEGGHLIDSLLTRARPEQVKKKLGRVKRRKDWATDPSKEKITEIIGLFWRVLGRVAVDEKRRRLKKKRDFRRKRAASSNVLLGKEDKKKRISVEEIFSGGKRCGE